MHLKYFEPKPTWKLHRVSSLWVQTASTGNRWGDWMKCREMRKSKSCTHPTIHTTSHDSVVPRRREEMQIAICIFYEIKMFMYINFQDFAIFLLLYFDIFFSSPSHSQCSFLIVSSTSFCNSVGLFSDELCVNCCATLINISSQFIALCSSSTPSWIVYSSHFFFKYLSFSFPPSISNFNLKFSHPPSFKINTNISNTHEARRSEWCVHFHWNERMTMSKNSQIFCRIHRRVSEIHSLIIIIINDNNRNKQHEKRFKIQMNLISILKLPFCYDILNDSSLQTLPITSLINSLPC